MVFNKNDVINILTTGGTIEKVYCELDGSLENREPIVMTKIVPRLRLPYLRIQAREIMAKDSLFMDDKDRDFILEAIVEEAKKGAPVLVIHGTDTMEVTARHCFTRRPEIQVPVVFTGAMKPLGFDDSDAFQNVTEAIFATQFVGPGYYISFHGKLFQVPNVRKNKQLGTFEETK